MYVGRDVLSSKTRGESERNVSAPGRSAGLCQFFRSAILEGYEKQTQREGECVLGLTREPVKNTRSLAVGAPHQ